MPMLFEVINPKTNFLSVHRYIFMLSDALISEGNILFSQH
uniref:Uncharacterized protein n=1 Tax=Rhizophora mucronata TaxID=61149 RepID=A0A2P2QDU6_RHIMU